MQRFLPKLRWPLEISRHLIPNQNGGTQEILLLKCPLDIAEPLPLNAAVGPLLQEMSGKRSTHDIFLKYHPSGVTLDLVEELVMLLDSSLYLESPNFFEKEAAYRRYYGEQNNREAVLAGLVYPTTQAELRKLVEDYTRIASPCPEVFAPQNTTTIEDGRSCGSLLGIKSPHIDYRRGGNGYGSVFPMLYQKPGDLFIVIGTNHQYSRGLFHLTTKDFVTPLGRCITDKDFVQQLAQGYGPIKSFAEEIVHKREHSLELQLPFLQYKICQPLIVPILVGSFHRYISSGKRPEIDDEYDSFVSVLVEAITSRRQQGLRVQFIAGVDMAHVGRQFGDNFELSHTALKTIEERDSAYLRFIQQHDQVSLFQHIAEDDDSRRICGFPTMYTLLDLMKRLRISYLAHIHCYNQAVDVSAGCCVSFAGMSFYET
jgi:MEMO1 family protein